MTFKVSFPIFAYINLKHTKIKTKMERVGKTVRMLLTESELEQLESLAKYEQRSLSNMVSIIVSEYLEKKKAEKENLTKL